MKILFVFIAAALSFQTLSAQLMGPIELRKIKLEGRIASKIKSTPVALMIDSKKGLKSSNFKMVNLNSKTPSGVPIKSSKIHITKKGSHTFLAQTFGAKEKERTYYLPVAIKAGKAFIDMGSSLSFDECYGFACESCELDVSGTGMTFCACYSHGDSCEVPDVSYPVRDILEKLFE